MDGTGDFSSIQEAILAARSFPDRQIVIQIKNGIYKEKVRIFSWNTNISLIGEDRDLTIITYDDYFDKINLGRNSTFFTATLSVEADYFYAYNLTIENTSGEVGQAIAVSATGDQIIFENCNLKGYQDTLYASGDYNRQYFKNCHIEGSTDFIFGGATVFFEKCIIHSLSNSYITAASTPINAAYGFVFYQCKLTAGEGVQQVFLGRPWRKYAKTVFLACEMGNHIKQEGWHNWNQPESEQTTFYGEYPLTNTLKKQRVAWAKDLKKKDVKKYTKSKVLGKDFWQPTS